MAKQLQDPKIYFMIDDDKLVLVFEWFLFKNLEF